MRKGLAFMVCMVFMIVAVAGLCSAQEHAWKSEGRAELVGKVVKNKNGNFVLKTQEGPFVIGGADLHSGADGSPWVGKKVKASGEVLRNPFLPVRRIQVDKFEAAE
jgi:hypothetical protein